MALRHRLGPVPWLLPCIQEGEGSLLSPLPLGESPVSHMFLKLVEDGSFQPL